MKSKERMDLVMRMSVVKTILKDDSPQAWHRIKRQPA